MAIEITGVPGTPVSNNKSDKLESTNLDLVNPKVSVSDNSANTLSTTADSLSVSNRAEILRALESTINAQPAVDANRVENLKTVIDAGRYDVDPFRVAEKLIAFESQIVA
jgi:negative regulator of flagellin synthesis FlgM